MPRTEEVTPYEIRSKKGEGFFVDTLSEALEEFLGPDGYRLTFSTPGKELTIRRASEWIPRFVNETECNASLTYRKTSVGHEPEEAETDD